MASILRSFWALLDRLGLSMPSTHSGATEGPDLEKQLEGFQLMGIKYVEISAPRASRAPGAGPGGPGAGGPGRGFGAQPPQTSDAVKLPGGPAINQHGQIAKKFGMKNTGPQPHDGVFRLSRTIPKMRPLRHHFGQ